MVTALQQPQQQQRLQPQVNEYKVVHLALKDDKHWEAILCGLGRDGWVLSGTVPLIDISLAGFPVTRGVKFILMRPLPTP